MSDDVSMLGNHLIELDPSSGAVLRSVHVGSHLSAVAVDVRGTVAYVASEEAGEIVRVSLSDFHVDRRFSYEPTVTTDWPEVEDLAVHPSDPDLVAVAFGRGVELFDGGIRLPEVWTNVPLPEPPFPGMTIDAPERVAFADDETMVGLIGSGSFIAGRLVAARVNAEGLVDERAVGDVTSAAQLGLVAAGGLVHLGSGDVVDPVDGEVVRQYMATGSIAFDPSTLTVLLAHPSADEIRAFSATDATEVGSVAAEFEPGSRLVATSAGLASTTRSGLVLYGTDVTTTGFVIPTPPPSVLDLAAKVTVPVHATSVVAGPDGESFYAVGGYLDPLHPGQVVEVDAASGDIIRSVFIGALVSELEVSRDGSTLLAVHAITPEVTELDVVSFEIVRRVRLQGGEDVGFGGDVLSLAGDPGRYLVVTWSDVDRDGSVVDLLLVDGGVATSVPRPFGLSGSPEQLVLDGSDAATVWGQGSGTAARLYRLVDDGEEVTHIAASLTLCCFGPWLVWADGSLYSGSGAVADLATMRQTGRYPGTGVVLPLPDRGRVLVFDGGIAEMDHVGFYRLQTHPLGRAADVERIGDLLALTFENSPMVLIPLAGAAAPVPTGADPEPNRCRSGFPDVGPDHSFCDEIAWLAALTITETPYLQHYRPDAPVSRQAMAVMLYRMAGRPHVWLADPPRFPDVVGGPFAPAIEWAASEGLFAGYHDGTFRPTAPVTRQAAAAVLHRSLGAPPAGGDGEFIDVPPGHPFATPIQWMAQNHIAEGFADGTFRPTAPVSRQAAAAFILRALLPHVAASFDDG